MKFEDFLNKIETPIKILEEYAPICTDLLRTDPNTIKAVSQKLKNNIIEWSTKNSFVYQNFDQNKIYSRKDLLEKNNWYVPSLLDNSYKCHTSGSTTGDPFNYLVWKKYHDFIEDDNQYGMILKEFDISDTDIKILILKEMKDNPKPESGKFSLINYGHTSNALHGHRTKICYSCFVDFSNYKDGEEWHNNLIEFFDQNRDIDVIISTGPIINIMTSHFKKFGFKQKICRLLSHTGEFPLQEDFKFLKDNGYVDHYCDSMRCWDGGATFFTCKYETCHLMDNLGWVECIDNKLVSTDFFSFPSPFINYWNGDLCEVENEYSLCSCGRYYRPFKMLQSRPFALKGPTKLNKIQRQISNLLFRTKISQIQFEELSISIYCNKKLEPNEVKTLNRILKDYKVKYVN